MIKGNLADFVRPEDFPHKKTKDGHPLCGDSFTLVTVDGVSVVLGNWEEGDFVYIERDGHLYGAGDICWDGYGDPFAESVGTSFWANGPRPRGYPEDAPMGECLLAVEHEDDAEEGEKAVAEHLHLIVEAWNGKDNSIGPEE